MAGQLEADITALLQQARQERTIDEAEIQALLFSADEAVIDALYDLFRREGIAITTEIDIMPDDSELGDTSALASLGR